MKQTFWLRTMPGGPFVPAFRYRARDRKGKLFEGTFEATDKEGAYRMLREKDWLPIKIEEAKARLAGKIPFLTKRTHVREQDLINFARQLGSMLVAGINILTALSLFIEEGEGSALAAPLRGVKKDIEGGKSLSQAMAGYPDVFPSICISVVRSGELGGNLGDAMGRLSDLLEFDQNIRAKIKAATRYPKIVIGVITIAAVIIFGFVVPRFAGFFEKLGAELPLPTQILLSIQTAFTQGWKYILLVIVVGFLLFRRIVQTEKGAYKWAAFQLKVPVLGELIRQIAITRLARFFGTLYQYGIPVLDALSIVAPIMRNPVISKAVSDIQRPVREGKKLSEAFEMQKIFTPFLIQMIAMGEATGNIPEALGRIASFYEVEVERSITRLTSYIEPALIAGIAVMVLFLALAVYLPMWSIFKAFRA